MNNLTNTELVNLVLDSGTSNEKVLASRLLELMDSVRQKADNLTKIEYRISSMCSYVAIECLIEDIPFTSKDSDLGPKT